MVDSSSCFVSPNYSWLGWGGELRFTLCSISSSSVFLTQDFTKQNFISLFFVFLCCWYKKVSQPLPFLMCVWSHCFSFCLLCHCHSCGVVIWGWDPYYLELVLPLSIDRFLLLLLPFIWLVFLRYWVVRYIRHCCAFQSNFILYFLCFLYTLFQG